MPNGGQDDGLPWIPAADRNKGPILTALRQVLPVSGRVLELGSGTGQHAVYFAAELPELVWQTSECASGLGDLLPRVTLADRPNLPRPIVVDVCASEWPTETFDAVYASNLVHFIPEAALETLFRTCAALLHERAPLIIYGPFNQGGRYTSEGNRGLDAWLRDIDTALGLRDIETVRREAAAAGLDLLENRLLPANNHLLVLRSSPSAQDD